MKKFKDHDYSHRLTEATRIIEKYPDRVPIIVETSENIKLDRHKYLVPRDLSCGQFLFVLRKRMKLEPSKAVFMFINKEIPPTAEIINHIYEKYKDTDKFLYIFITEENTFGF